MAADEGVLGRTLEQRRVRDAYGFALALVLVSTLGLVAAGSPLVSPLAAIAGLLQIGALLVTLHVSGIHHRWTRFASVMAVGLFVAAVVLLFWLGEPARIPGLIVWLILTIATIAAIVRRLVTYGQVTLQLLMGLLVIYLLIGVGFGLTYALTDALRPPALAPDGQGVSGAIYYSFITLATVGYGDIVPASSVVRAMAMAESLIGQLYLVSVVSLAVSRLGVRKRSDAPAEDIA